MNLFELFATISLDTSEYEKNLDKAGKGFSDFGGKLKSGLATAAKIGAGFTTAITAGAGGAIAALNGIAESTEESRIATGKLNTAFEAAGMSTEAAATAYNEFYKILGDTDTATEASQLLAQLAENEQDLTEWTRIAAGVNGTFGDSLPIEALIESANETAKVGQVTGNLADALNWVGISEDEFNAKLAAASSESERNQLIMKTLSGTYEKASESFYKNNDAIVKQRESQIKLDEAMSKVGASVANVKNNITSGFMPAIVKMADGLAKIIGNDNTGLTALNSGITEFVNKLSTTVSSLFEVGTSIVTTLVDGVVNNIPQLVSAASDIVLKLTGYITESLPNLASAAIEIVTTLGGKIAEAAPQLIAGVTATITKLVEMLTNPEQLNKMLDVGLTLITTVGQALVDNVGKITEKIPQIVETLVNFFTNPNNVESVVGAGVELVSALLDNADEILTALFASADKIINGIVGFFTGKNGGENAISKIANAGIELISALFNNMSEIDTILEKKVKSISESIKKFFRNINWQEVGLHIIDFITFGIKSNIEMAKEAAELMAQKMLEIDWSEVGKKSLTAMFQGPLGVVAGEFGYESYAGGLVTSEQSLSASNASRINITENIYVQGNYDDAAQRKNNARLANQLAR